MKKLFLILALAFAAPLLVTSCNTTPQTKNYEVQTLKAVGHTAETAVALGAHLYHDGKITADQARHINELYDQKFQPAFRLAVSAAQSNLGSIASPDLAALAAELSAYVASLQTHTP